MSMEIKYLNLKIFLLQSLELLEEIREEIKIRYKKLFTAV